MFRLGPFCRRFVNLFHDSLQDAQCENFRFWLSSKSDGRGGKRLILKINEESPRIYKSSTLSPTESRKPSPLRTDKLKNSSRCELPGNRVSKRIHRVPKKQLARLQCCCVKISAAPENFSSSGNTTLFIITDQLPLGSLEMEDNTQVNHPLTIAVALAIVIITGCGVHTPEPTPEFITEVLLPPA